MQDISEIATKLQVEDLSLSWEGQPVCEDISFSISQGEILGLVGRSGSGKTTLFHALAGLTNPDSGNITLDGESIVGKPGYVSYMLQNDLLLDQYTVLDNVALPLRIKGENKSDARKEASLHFEEFGIVGSQEKYPAQLSGGMRQRAALLRTYLMGDDVVLLDEPFSALDSMTRKDMQQWLLEMISKLNLSAMLITHDIDEAIFLSDKILVLSSDSGKLPSTLSASIAIDCPRDRRADFALSQEALDIKKRILQILDK